MKAAVLFVLPHLAFGGAERLATFIIRHLKNLGFTVLVAEAGQDRDLPNAGEMWFAPLCPLHRLGHLTDLEAALLDLVNRYGVSSLVICGRSPAYRCLPRLAGARPDLRVVSFQFNAKEGIADNRRYAPYLDAVIAESLDAATALSGGDEWLLPIRVISSGVDVKSLAERTVAARSEGPLCVSYVGRFDRSKNPEGFVEMVRQVSTPDLRFVMAGAGPPVKYAPERVEQLGLLTGDALLSHMDRIDILVVPSRNDGRPMVIQEAQARRIPVVASRVGGIPELVEHGVTGLLCAPEDGRGLAEAVDRLANDPALRRRLADAAFERVRREGDIDGVLPLYVAAITGSPQFSASAP